MSSKTWSGVAEALILCLAAAATSVTAVDGEAEIIRRAQAVPWTPLGLSGGGNQYAVAVSPVNPNLMMDNCDMGAAYVTENGGRDWTMINHAQLQSSIRCHPCYHPVEAGVVYAANGDSSQIWVSRDRGHNWKPLSDFKLPRRPAKRILVDSSHPECMLVGIEPERGQESKNSAGCAMTRNGGQTWEILAGPKGNPAGFHFDQTAKGSGKIIFAATELGVWRSDDAGRTWAAKNNGLPWQDLRDFYGGSIKGGDEIILYGCIPSKNVDGKYQGGIYRSFDRGETWESALGEGCNKDLKATDEWSPNDACQYHRVLTTDVKPRTVYGFNSHTGIWPPHHEAIYRSDDAGAHWRATFYSDPRMKECNVAPSWFTVGENNYWPAVPRAEAICNSNPEIVFHMKGMGEITHDGGKTWSPANTYPALGQEKVNFETNWVCNGLVVTTTWHYYIDPFESNRHYIAYTDCAWARSLDSGKTWRWWNHTTQGPWHNTCYEVAFDPAAPGLMWGAFSDLHDCPNDNTVSYRIREFPGGICISRDFGYSWKSEAKGLPLKPVTSVVLDPDSPKGARTLYAGVFEDGVYKSTDNGANWVLKKNGLGDPKNMRVHRVFLHQDKTLFACIAAKRLGSGQPYAAEGVGLYRSRDGGENWEKITASQPFFYVKDFSVHPGDSRVILLGVCDHKWDEKEPEGGLWRTTDGGGKWEKIGRQARQTFGGYFHPKFKSWIYMTLTEGNSGPGLWLSRDDGKSWEAFKDLPFRFIQRVVFDPADEAAMYVTTFGGSVWHGPVAPRTQPADIPSHP